MMRVLTEQESIESNKQKLLETDAWWSTLSIKEKKSIFDYHKDMFKHVKCVHEFHSLNFYSTKVEQCGKCGYSRNIEESRDEKINDITYE